MTTIFRVPLLAAALCVAALAGCSDQGDDAAPPVTEKRDSEAGTANPGSQVDDVQLDEDGSRGMDASPYDQTGANSQGGAR